MSDEEDKENFDEMFDGMDADKIEMDVAMESIANLYKGLRYQGLERIDAAYLVIAMVQSGGDFGGKSEN